VATSHGVCYKTPVSSPAPSVPAAKPDSGTGDPGVARPVIGVVVAGAGRFGAIHAAKLVDRSDVRIRAVVDPDLARARSLAAASPGAIAVGSLHELPRTLDAQVGLVATPIPALAQTTRGLLERGLHCLVEKPGAESAHEASALVRAAARAERLLAVGFVERFNQALPRGGGFGRALVVRRAGPPRGGAGPIALDWGIHDLDLAHHLLGAPLDVLGARVEADRLSIRLGGAEGARALLVCDRTRPRTWRRLWLDGLRIDLAGPRTQDALAAQWTAFLSGVRGGPIGPLAVGRDAVAALALAEALPLHGSVRARAAG
jgi:predicted dehydrogenase